MRRAIGLVVVALVMLAVVPVLVLPGAVGADDPVVEEWVARYDGPASNYDSASAIAVDGSGNVYVTGISHVSGTDSDYATIKYNPDGNQLWVARYDGPAGDTDSAKAIAVDGSGNVYVTGQSRGSGTEEDYATIKYDRDGKQVWVARYDGPVNGNEAAVDLAVDGSGNVYVTGWSFGSGTSADYATIKYDPEGDELWVARYDGPPSDWDGALAIAVDGTGNVYVTGQSRGSGTGDDYATVKYGPDGNELWVARYDGPANGNEAAVDLAVDGSGNVYVTGFSQGSGTGWDYATIKYGPDGDKLWVARYDGPASDWDVAWDVAVDGSGNVYVTGGSRGTGTGNDYATIRYDSDGDEVWVARYDGPQSWSDTGRAMAIDGSGNVYVTGGSFGSGTSADYATIKYDPEGNEQWVAIYDGSASKMDFSLAIALDSSGNVYVTGVSDGVGTSGDYATIKYSPPPPVGGTIVPTDKLGLVMPWIMAGALIVAAGVSLALWNRKRGGERASGR
ncbi:hypothetical protein ES703_00463 [subsurface metagenome]